MDIELKKFRLGVGSSDNLQATVLSAQRELPGVLFVHGWGGSQGQDLSRARDVAALGCVCLTFDLRGHSEDSSHKETVTREQNLQDLCASYDWLSGQSSVDSTAMAVVGVSYGGYLAALLSALRPVRWLVLRTPALYPDAGWQVPKAQLNRDPDLSGFRHRPLAAEANRALSACARFEGDALLVEAGQDAIIPHQVIENFASAFKNARSMTRRLIEDADHAFSGKEMQRQYNQVLVNWMTEMVVGSRKAIAADKVQMEKWRRNAGDSAG